MQGPYAYLIRYSLFDIRNTIVFHSFWDYCIWLRVMKENFCISFKLLEIIEF